MEDRIKQKISEALKLLYGVDAGEEHIQLQKTRKEFDGDITLVVFPLLRFSGKSPEQTGTDLGNFLKESFPGLKDFNIIKGFLNLEIDYTAWLAEFNNLFATDKEQFKNTDNKKTILIEYSSPNTNKPLHLGHIRNNILGYSLYRILSSLGHEVIKTNIVNDRGIHICKSMLAWEMFADGETPDETGLKGDHFVGKYYVEFEKAFRREIEELEKEGMNREEAVAKSELMEAARQMLRKWEKGDSETIALWEKMNSWVYEGFDRTYKDLGVDFDKIYYESDTYKLGRKIVEEGLKNNKFYKKEDGSVWADLSSENLDEKLLLRADGTAVYITQDLGTAIRRYDDYGFDLHYYVVGNEQDYHFKVLKLLLNKLGYDWADGIHHFSYGMVNLPEGRMKSREGKVVDADDLIATMVHTAREMSDELGKLNEYTEAEKSDIYRKVGLGALKYFILKVDPRKNMMFNPRESIDFNGNTGPFIQYTYARIRSVMRKVADMGIEVAKEHSDVIINEKEKDLIIMLRKFSGMVNEAAENLNPSIIANYIYDLAREFNQFYHDYTILGEDKAELRNFRIALSEHTGYILKEGMYLLGIDMPERM